MSLFHHPALLLGCALLSHAAQAQQPAPPTAQQKAAARAQRIEYNACPLRAYCMDCGTTPADLLQVPVDAYFHQQLTPAQITPLTGTVMVQIMVDTTGVACCLSVQNLTARPNASIEALHLDRLVAAMPRWQPARTGSRAQTASTTVRLQFEGAAGFSARHFRLGRSQPKP
jgi:hypothetical protein